MSEHHWSDFAASYALGALDPEERAEFERHLSDCGRCRRELDSYQQVVAGMAEGAPPQSLPAGLRDRVLSQAQGNGSSGRPAPVVLEPRPESPLRSVVSRVLVGLTAASIVLAAGIGVLLSRSSAALVDLERVVDARRTELVERDQTIARQQALLDALLAPDISTASLVSAAPSTPRLQLFWNRGTSLLVVAAFNLPPAPNGRTYQLWGIQGDEPPVSLGLFDVPADDPAVTLTSPSSVAFDVAAVTEEPATGSAQPTSAPFLVGTWNHTDD